MLAASPETLLLLGSMLALSQLSAALPTAALADMSTAAADPVLALVRRASTASKNKANQAGKKATKGLSRGAIVAIVVVIVVVVILATAAYFLWRLLKKRKAAKASAQMNHDSGVTQPLSAGAAPDPHFDGPPAHMMQQQPQPQMYQQFGMQQGQPPLPPPPPGQQGSAASYYNAPSNNLHY